MARNSHNMVKVEDNYFVSPNGDVVVKKSNATGSWFVYKNKTFIASYGMCFNACVFATELQKVGA